MTLPFDRDWRTDATRDLCEALLRLETVDEAERFLRDLCTLGELRDMAQRWQVARLLDAGMHYAEISRRTGASTATITRIAAWLHHGEGGYGLLLERTRRGARATSGRGAASAPGDVPDADVSTARDDDVARRPGDRAPDRDGGRDLP